MNQIASAGQLRLAYMRWALVTVPVIVLLGFLSGKVANSGYGNRWFAMLDKPDLMPPGWAFPVAWGIIYVLMGLSIAVILDARGARGRGLAILLFVAQLVMNLIWSPLFFRAHQVSNALILVIAMALVVAATIWAFGRIRRVAALLLVPYLLWLAFASYLNYEISTLNPGAETLVVPALKAQI